jgi:hypothetical protein
MAAYLQEEERIEVFSFLTSFEGICGLLIDLDLYVFNKVGELIDCQPIWNGKASVALSEKELIEARIMIGPPIRVSIRRAIMQDMIRDRHGFEVGFSLIPEKRSVELSAVPERIWRVWQQTGSLNKGRKAFGLFDDFLLW